MITSLSNILPWFRKRMVSWSATENFTEISVTDENVQQIGAVYSCIRLIGETIACLPFGVHEMVDDQPRKADGHYLHDLLSRAPNADQSPIEFWETVIACIGLRGHCFLLKHLNRSGEIIALEQLPYDDTTFWRKNAAGGRECVVSHGNRAGVYSEDQIVFFRGFGHDPDRGMSVVRYGANTFGSILATEKHRAKMMARGARPNMILTTPQLLSADQREQVRKNIVDPFVGSENAGGVMTLEAGFDMKQVTMSPVDAQLLEQMQFGVEEVCRWFRVPPAMIGHTQKSTTWGTGLEHMFIAFVRLCLLPYTKRIIQGTHRQCLRAEERSRFRPYINLDGLMEGDSDARSNFITRMVGGGVYTPNEGRAKENKPPLPGGDNLYMQQQMTPIADRKE